jgi:alanyl-tRNA synthetase
MNIENLNPVNAETQGVVDPNQTQVVPPSANGVNEEVANPQNTTQQPDVNASFAALRREKEALQQQTDLANQLIAKLYGSDGITDVNALNSALTQAEQQAQVEQQAQQLQANPALIQELNSLKSEIDMMKQEKQSAERDRAIKDMKNQMQEVLKMAQSEGMSITEDQLLSAAQEKNMNNFHDVYKLIKPDTNSQEYKDKIIADYINSLKNGQIPVEGGGNTPSTVVSTPKSWDDARKGAMELLRGKIK